MEKIIEQLQRNIHAMEKSAQCQCNDCIELRAEIDVYGTLIGSLADKCLVISSSSSQGSEAESDMTAEFENSSSKSLSSSSTVRKTQQVRQQQQTFKQ